MPFSLIYVKYLEYINPKKSLLLDLISVDRKHFHIYPKLVKLAKVIAVSFVFGLAGDTCTDLSNRGHLGQGSLVAVVTEY